MAALLWSLTVTLFVIWLIANLAFHVTGGLIHLLLVVALIMIVINLITGRGVRT